MKKIAIFVFLIFSYNFTFSQELKIMTFNIRWASPDDGQNKWEFRKDHVAETILFFDTDIVGLQEALQSQIEDLETRMPNYSFVGVGRDDGKQKGEFSPIFYNKNKFKVIKSGTFWLSENPSIPSKSWDAALPRICTWALFKSKIDGKQFYAFNTHFDHIGNLARVNSASLIKNEIQKITGSLPYVLIGDFNVTPEDKPYSTITKGEFKLDDSFITSKSGHFGPFATFNGFKDKEEPGKRIDYIFTKSGLEVIKHSTLSFSWEGLFASDHFAVLAVVKPWN